MIEQVLRGERKWTCVQSDALEFLRSLPDDSIDLLFTSPPYEDARTYGIGFKRTGQAWVDWMVEIIKAAAPKVKGLIAVNCEGRTRNYAYSGVPFLLFADLHRAGFNMRKPCVFNRVGIPGSGGPDWLRNDWEPIICVTRTGKLPWSDNTACGHPPKWAPGGAMSNRTKNGARVNQWGHSITTGATVVDKGGVVRSRGRRPSHFEASIAKPAIANPGNVIRCNVGGGQMGHPLASENEAPFPLELAEFYVKSFCPPGGKVCDPFAGSGTVIEAAVTHGRRFVGCDLRQSQVELCERRMATVTPDMFASAAVA